MRPGSTDGGPAVVPMQSPANGDLNRWVHGPSARLVGLASPLPSGIEKAKLFLAAPNRARPGFDHGGIGASSAASTSHRLCSVGSADRRRRLSTPLDALLAEDENLAG